MTVAGVFAAGVFIAAALLMQGINLLPYGIGALALGFLYLIPYGVNEREDAWRNAGLNLFASGVSEQRPALAAYAASARRYQGCAKTPTGSCR